MSTTAAGLKAARAGLTSSRATPSRSLLSGSVNTSTGTGRPCRRCNSSVATRTPPTDSKAAYDRLRPILDHLPAQVDWAVAYGSGVKHQANAASGPLPMTDFLIATPDPLAFHTDNLAENAAHYPTWARIAGSGRIARVQEDYGAGIWYVTMVTVNGLEVKYGIISTARLIQDLEGWDTLYTAGRLHKPVLTLKSTPAINTAQSANLLSAASTSLLLLQDHPTFTERDLYMQIAGLSYSGDPRMSVPGAENPDKVKNIVSGPGSLVAFRELYADPLARTEGLDLGESIVEKGDESGDAVLRMAYEPAAVGALVGHLPLKLRHALALKTGLLSSKEAGMTRVQVMGELEEIKGEEWTEKVQARDFRPVLMRELRNIMHRPALTQSMKGLATAGLVKSVRYSMAKFSKWLASRKK